MSKGTKRERECHGLYEQAGFKPYRPATVRFGENDMWGLFDVLAVRESDESVHAVQVKSNAARGITKWCKETSLWRSLGWETIYAVPVDREGWRLLQCTSDGHETLVDERDSDCNMGEDVVEYLSHD